MPSPQSQKIHIYSRAGSPNWWMWYYAPDGCQIRKSTSLTKTLYTRDQAQAIVDGGAKQDSEPDMTVGWLRDHILARLEIEDRPANTIKQYRNSFDYLEAVLGGGCLITAISRDIVWRVKEYGLSKGVRPVTVNTRLRFLHAAFNMLVKDDVIEANPFRGFDRLRERASGPKHLSLDETKRFLQVVDSWENKIGRRLIRIIMYTGIRRSEVLEIRRADVDMRNSRFRALNIKSRDKHTRWLPIPIRVREHFLYFLSTSDSQYPFRRCHPDTLGDWAKSLLKQAGFPGHSLKSLRHTFATLSLEHGISIRELQRYMDHSDVRVTEIYAHDKPDDTRAIEIGI